MLADLGLLKDLTAILSGFLCGSVGSSEAQRAKRACGGFGVKSLLLILSPVTVNRG